ncbi:MAG: MFS transporter [Oscillospiraceae bacterium]|jgi:Na+/melibiose symporter-like transporter|nr:MFS transporter [Oscillospiraceae bacterium]
MANPATALQTYSKKERGVYLTGMFGQNVIYNVIGTIFVSYFLQNILYIPAMTVGVIVAVARVWDAFNDPMMGTIVDRTRSKWGKARPYLIFSPSVIFVVTILCFVNGTFDTEATALTLQNVLVVGWAALSYILWGMSYTVGDISLWGLTSLLTEDEKHRQKLQAAARLAAGIGTGVAVLALQPLSLAAKNLLLGREAAKHGIDYALVAADAQKTLTSVADAMKALGFTNYAELAYRYEKMGYFIVAAIFTFVGAVTFQLVGLFTKEKITPSVKTNSVKENFKLMWNNKPFRRVLISGTLSGPTMIMMTVAMPLVTYYYATKEPGGVMLFTAVIGGGLFLGMFISTALVPAMLRRLSKKRLYVISNLVAVLPSACIALQYYIVVNHTQTDMTNPVCVAVMAALLTVGGVRLGVNNALQTMMISDCVDYEDFHSGLRPDGVFFSGQTFMAKIGSGIATIVYGFMSAGVGFSGGKIKALDQFVADGGVPRETVYIGEKALSIAAQAGGAVREYALTGGEVRGFFTMMFLAVSVPPAIGCLLSVLPMLKYPLSEGKLAEIREALQQRRRAAQD